MVASSAETTGAFNTGFDRVNLHRPTTRGAAPTQYSVPVMMASMVMEPSSRVIQNKHSH